MNIDHVIGTAVGIALAGILIVPLCILVYWLVRGYQIRRDAEALAKVAALIDDMKRELESLRHESERWAKSNAGLESAKLQWKKQYDDLVQKHNALVRTHNDIVRKYNAYLTQAKSQAGAKTEADSQLKAFTSEVQELRVRLDEALKGKQDLLAECQGLQRKIEILDSEGGALQRKLADALKQLQAVSSSPTPSSQSPHQPELGVGDLLSEIAELRRKIVDNNRCNDDLVARISHFQKDMEDLTRQNLELDRQLKEHRGVNAELAGELATDRKQRQEVERENQALRVKNQALEEKRREAVSQHEKLIHEHQGYEQEAQKLRSENSALSQKLEELARHLKMALAGLSAGYGETVQDTMTASSGVGEHATSSNGKLIIPRWQDTRPVVVGLDFGTFSTKVVVRVRGERKSRTVFIDDPTDGYPAFVVPSLVRLNAGKLFFGRRALQENRGSLFRSLKVALLPPTSRDGWVQESFPMGTTPDLLVAFYLSWVLGRLKTILGQETMPQLSLNVAAPMDHLEDAAMKERYLHVVHAAWQATFGPYPIRVDQGADLHQFRPLFEFWLERTVPDLTVRRFEILPETLAPLVSLSQDPRVKAGLYLMVDMGAGTTELSVSHVSELDADHRILCYADTSIMLGGNQFKGACN